MTNEEVALQLMKHITALTIKPRSHTGITPVGALELYIACLKIIYSKGQLTFTTPKATDTAPNKVE